MLYKHLQCNSKSDPVYEDPQLQANPSYVAAGNAKVENEEEDYIYIWNLL